MPLKMFEERRAYSRAHYQKHRRLILLAKKQKQEKASIQKQEETWLQIGLGLVPKDTSIKIGPNTRKLLICIGSIKCEVVDKKRELEYWRHGMWSAQYRVDVELGMAMKPHYVITQKKAIELAQTLPTKTRYDAYARCPRCDYCTKQYDELAKIHGDLAFLIHKFPPLLSVYQKKDEMEAAYRKKRVRKHDEEFLRKTLSINEGMTALGRTPPLTQAAG